MEGLTDRIEHGTNDTKVVDSIPVHIYLRVELNDPCGFIPTQNIL